MYELVEMYFQWPVLPFSVLLCLVSMYWFMVIVSGIDLDVFDIDLDIDLDFDADTSPSVADFGMLGLKWLNIGEVPLMFWLSIVGLTSWSVTMMFDHPMGNATSQAVAVVVARNLGLGILAAKILTNPLRGKFRAKEPNTISEMMGRHCSIVTSEATMTHGNAICHIEEGAPLRLNVRMVEGSAPKGTVVKIVEYEEASGVYFVQDTGERTS